MADTSTNITDSSPPSTPPEKDLLKSKTFWSLAALLLGLYGPKWGIDPETQSTVLNTLQHMYGEVQSLGLVFGAPAALLSRLVSVHKITSVAGYKLQGPST